MSKNHTTESDILPINTDFPIRLAMLEIQDASMVKLSGETHHPIALPSPSDTMLGLM
jgi:hypothetical protein